MNSISLLSIILFLIELYLNTASADSVGSPNLGREGLNLIQRYLVCSQPNNFGFKKRGETNKYYAIGDFPMSWFEAENFCQSFGAHLPIVNSSEDTTFLRSLLGDKVKTYHNYYSDSTCWHCTGYWLGLYHSSYTNTWRWVDNSPLSYTEWGPDSNVVDNERKVAYDYYVVHRGYYYGWNFMPITFRGVQTICELKC